MSGKHSAKTARAQRTSDTLPTQTKHANDRKVLRKAGVKFGKPVPADGLFTYVTLPAGWRIARTDHNPRSYLLDDKGRKRASIFHDDGYATIGACCRFDTQRDRDFQSANNTVRVIVTDGNTGTTVFTTYDFSIEREEGDSGISGLEAADKLAESWLNYHHPDWENPSAYWD